MLFLRFTKTLLQGGSSTCLHTLQYINFIMVVLRLHSALRTVHSHAGLSKKQAGER